MRYRRTTDQVFRRNLMVAGICHLALIAGVFMFERFSGQTDHDRDESVTVEIFTPADLLGDMPRGDGYGRGAYTPPSTPPAGGTSASLGAPPAPAPAPPAAAPAPSPVPVPQAVAVPKKTPAPKAKATVKSTSTPKAGTSKPKTKTGTTTSSGTARKAGPSAGDIRNRFASALQAAEGGTPYGDGKKAGGGEGSSPVIGSPNGSPDGVVGGVGKGSKHWAYYQHVHDRMYAAWDQPGEVQDRRLVTRVKLVIARNGSVLQASVVGRSGNKIMDTSALTAARSVPKLNPLPSGLGGTTASITVDFELEG